MLPRNESQNSKNPRSKYHRISTTWSGAKGILGEGENMSRSIFAKSLPNGSLGTKPPAPPQVKVVVAEYITPTVQRLTYTTVDANSEPALPDAEQQAKVDAGQQVTDVDFYKAPNPILADVKPATAEFGNGKSKEIGGPNYLLPDGSIGQAPGTPVIKGGFQDKS
jgi:hypothetical protein